MTEFVFIEERPEEGRRHTVASAVSIGRQDCDLIVEDPEVSRRHLQLRVAGATIAVEDLGSTHGTFVNGTQVAGVHELSEGDTVEFGATVWRLQPVMPEMPVAPPEPPPEATEQMPAAAPPQREFAPSSAPAAQPAAPAGGFPEPRTRRGRSAARSLTATAYSYGVVGATAVALIVYFASR